MSAIPPNLARVPVLLSSQSLLSNLTRTNSRLLETQVQMASGYRVNRPSDEPVGASLALNLQSMMEQRAQRMRNLQYAEAALNVADNAIHEATGIVREARDIGMSMIGLGGDPETRRSQAEVINSMIHELAGLANTRYHDLHLFGGTQTARPPLEELLGGYRYTGTRDGLTIDLGIASAIPITIPAHQVFGSLSARVEGDRDLDPALTPENRLSDLNGARGLGVSLGTVRIEVAGVGSLNLDLTGAESVQDVIERLDAAIAQIEADSGVALLGPGRVGINTTADGFFLDVLPGFSIEITDVGGTTAAADLGLNSAAFTNGNTDGESVDPRLALLTRLTDLDGIGALENFVITNAGQIRTIDLVGAVPPVETIQDLANAIRRAKIGVRLEIADDGKRLNLVNELSGAHMSVSEEPGGQMAMLLGIRSFAASTRLSDFNDGRGVGIRSGSVDPNTGLPDPALDIDFRITLSDASFFDVDLAGAETVQDVIDLIMAAADAAGIPPGNFEIALTDGPNGFTLRDNTGGPGNFSVAARNGSFAAEDLGILGSTSGATLAGEDRAMIAVDGIFTHMLRLRDALLTNDERGIEFATERIERDLDRFAQARAIVGQRASRIAAQSVREEDRQLLDLNLTSQIRDLDFTEASIRFTTLQAQLQAALMTGAQSANLSLIRFLR
jgi:flagellin-like hook-associated protein FlgL